MAGDDWLFLIHNRNMSSTSKNEHDRRVKRTKSDVFDAFFQMVQSSRYDELKVVDIIEKSGIGKSTFYEHFSGKDDVLSQSLEGPMSVFARALAGNGNRDTTRAILDHFWERRVLARVILQHPTRKVVDRCLQTLVMAQLNNTIPLNEHSHNHAKACLLACGFLSLLEEWLVGKIYLSTDQLLAHVDEFSLVNSLE